MKTLIKNLINLVVKQFEKPLYKVHTETNRLLWIKDWSESNARQRAYQLVGSENFTIKRI